MTGNAFRYERTVIPADARHITDLPADTHENILSYFDGIGDELTRAQVLSVSGPIYWASEDWQKLLHDIEMAQEIYARLDMHFLQFVLKTWILETYRVSGAREKADSLEIFLVETIAEGKIEGDPALIRRNFAMTYFNTGRYELAIEYFLQGLPEFEREENWDLVADSWYYMGIAYESIERNASAVDAYRECIKALEKTGNQELIHQNHIRIIFPLIAIQNYDEARRYMDLARQDSISGIEEEAYLQASLDDAQGQILLGQEQFNEAISYFNRAWEGFEEIGDQYALPFPPLRLARCFINTGCGVAPPHRR